jgi:acetolactate synthase-1/2/3 large subunit
MGIPVITTLHGKGAFPESHALSLGMSGMHGWVHANRAIQECDVLFNIGGRFDDRVTGKVSSFAPRAQIIHVDIDPSEIGKVVPTSIGIHGDARATLTCMLELAPACDRAAWLARIRKVQAEHEPHQAYRRRPDTPTLMPHDVFASLDRAFRKRTGYRVVTDVGQHQMWAAQLIEWVRPRSHITSGGAGTMGFSIPAALGAALAHPGETIWVIVGDGGFQMTNQEIATMVQEDVRNVKIAVINNGYLGMVRQWQELFEGARYSGTKLSGPDISLLSEAYGVRGMMVERPEDADAAIESAWAHDGLVVIDFRVEREANVFPIVPAGKSISEMMVTATANA